MVQRHNIYFHKCNEYKNSTTTHWIVVSIRKQRENHFHNVKLQVRMQVLRTLRYPTIQIVRVFIEIRDRCIVAQAGFPLGVKLIIV